MAKKSVVIPQTVKRSLPDEMYKMGYMPSGPDKPCPINIAIANSILTGGEAKKAYDWAMMKPEDFDKKYNQSNKDKKSE